MKTIESLGFDIKEQRITKGYTKNYVAAQCGVSLTMFSNWESSLTKQVKDDNWDALYELLKPEYE